MQDRQTRVLETFNAIVPKMTELEQEKLLSFGEGLKFLLPGRKDPPPAAERPGA